MSRERNEPTSRRVNAMAWPDGDELLAWWLYLQHDMNRQRHITADDYVSWLKEYKEKGRMKVHRMLHNEFLAFRLKFRHPDN